RVVGEVVLGKERVHAVLVGMPPGSFPEWADCIDGDLPHDGGPHELVVGSTLARRLGLKVGAPLLPFYRNDRGARISRIVGVFRPDAPVWQANLILTTLKSATRIFAQEKLVTDLLVWCKPGGYQEAVTRAIESDRSLSFPGVGGLGTVRAHV